MPKTKTGKSWSGFFQIEPITAYLITRQTIAQHGYYSKIKNHILRKPDQPAAYFSSLDVRTHLLSAPLVLTFSN
jgi:hypothetical protein